jgi:hypothetical protein
VRCDKSVDDVGQTSCAQSGWLADDVPDRRTVGEIQGKVIKQSKRNAISRLLHAKNDKDTIAGWKSELNRVLHVFNVRSVIFTWSSLTVRFQTELAMNTHTIVSDIHRNILKSQEGTDGKNQLVSDNCTLFIAELTLTVT